MNEKIRTVYDIAEEELITLDGIKANAYPADDLVLINNSTLDEEKEFTEVIVTYEKFMNIIRERDGRFTSR